MSGLGFGDETDHTADSHTQELQSLPHYGKGVDLLKRAGWEGGGLGRNQDGMLNPIAAQDNMGRQGLGSTEKPATVPGSRDGQGKVDESRVKSVSVRSRDRKPIEWLKCTEKLGEEFKYDSALIIGKEEYDYDQFCCKEKVQELFDCKDKLNNVNKATFLEARRRANPYETIGKSIFINRAAVKLANLDYLCRDLVPLKEVEKFYFCDVCAGPGGFTEYVLWKRRSLHSRGWGMTLKGNDDWKFYRFNPEADVTGRFEACYGVDGEGNVYNSENLRDFQRIVLEGTDGKGVQLYTADGGFCVDGNENYQEVEVKRLVLNQFLCMLCVLRTGGHFVCKIFDVFTPFTVGLLYLLHKLFDEFALVKPVTSRPANSERYVVCKCFKKQNPTVIIDYLFKVNESFDKKKKEEDIIQLVNPLLIQSDKPFLEVIRASNLQIIEAQIAALNDLVLYIEDLHLRPFARQDVVKDYALSLWSIPPQKPYDSNHHRGGYHNRGHRRGGRGRGRGGGRSSHQQEYRPDTKERERPQFYEPERKRRSYSDASGNPTYNRN